jgi:RNA polymerase sigma-70 factor (ECF subfamily)
MDTTDSDTLDRADMASLVAGKDEALNALMARHATRIFHFLHRMLANQEDANDLAQETFVRVYHSRASFKPSQRFSTWAFTIAANLGRNHLRWRTRHPNVSLDAESDSTQQSLGDTLPGLLNTPHQAAEAAERTNAVRAAVDSLPEDMREAILLCEWEDMAVAEAAGILRTTPKAVESRLYRARQILRQKLEKWLQSPTSHSRSEFD